MSTRDGATGDDEFALGDGDVALVTGSTDGIGKEIARGLAETGATVLLHGRDREKGRAAVEEIATDVGTDALGLYAADFTDFAAVRDLADAVAAEYGRLDVLVNNAGTWQGERRLVDVPGSDEGIEMTFAVNHLAHFLLTVLLEESLASAAEARSREGGADDEARADDEGDGVTGRPDPTRVVTVSSDLHRRASLDLDGVRGSRGPKGIDAYAHSKLANVLFTMALARRLPDGVTATACHPGIVPSTAIDREGWLPRKIGWAALGLVGPLFGVTSSPADAARTPLLLARSRAVAGETGAYFSDGRREEPSAAARDRDDQKRLWSESVDLLDLSGDERLSE